MKVMRATGQQTYLAGSPARNGALLRAAESGQRPAFPDLRLRTSRPHPASSTPAVSNQATAHIWGLNCRSRMRLVADPGCADRQSQLFTRGQLLFTPGQAAFI